MGLSFLEHNQGAAGLKWCADAIQFAMKCRFAASVGRASPNMLLVLGLAFGMTISCMYAEDSAIGSTSSQDSAPGPSLPDNAYGETPAGVPYSNLFRNTGAPYLRPSASPSIHSDTNIGDSEGSLRLNAGRFSSFIPLLHRGFEPKDADLKLGPVFIDFHSLSGGVLASDNVYRSETVRKAGIISVIRLGVSMRVQLTESLHFSLAGNLTAFPLKNTAGISGFGLIAPLLMEATPLLQGQLAQSEDMMIGGWPVVIADDFRAGEGAYSYGIDGAPALFEGSDYDEYDRAGRYFFSPRYRKRAGRDVNTREPANRNFTYFSNVASIQTERLLPGSIRLRAGVFHENLWYNNSERGLPRMRDQGHVYIGSERDNTRFKPYAEYRFIRTDSHSGVDQWLNVGIHGPITDQLNVRTELGYALSRRGYSRLLWLGELNHVAGPYTQQSLYFRRGYSEFADEIHTGVGYRLNQTLGPDLKADFFVRYFTSDDIDTDTSRRYFQTGLRLSYYYSPRTQFSLSGIYIDRIYDNLYGSSQWWLGRAEMHHKFTDTFTGRLYYQFTKRDAGRRGENFYENMVFLYVTKDLD
jgi:hypothetical protein